KADPTGIFLAPGDNIAIGSPKVNVYGSIGIENVILGAGSSQVVLDQNVERVYLSAAPFAYRFQQSGIRLDGYAETGSDPIFSAALQNDADGTVLVFPSGSASAKVSAAGMTLGGATVSSTVPFAVSPSLGGYVAPPTAATNTGVFLGQNANFTAASAGLKLYGAAGGEVVALKRGVSDISVDQLVDRVQFDGLATAALRFQQQGINLLVYDESTLLAKIPLQSDVDGTLVTTTTGTVQAKVSATGMFLGGVRVSANEASSLVPADVDSSLKAAPGGIGPLITLFTSTSDNGIYKAGSTINITAVASEALAAGSQITVTLETGTTDRTVVLTRDGTDATKL
ncbi:MAG: hypothetical protein EBZ75_16015, partial [Oxalobacteraceae bacterium]|nr:hypothetical protein [Oxalobacteraceae bacterium]